MGTSELGKRYYTLRCKSALVPMKFELLKDYKKESIATFAGYRIIGTNRVRFVTENLMALLELPPHDRAAIDEALAILNSDECYVDNEQ